MARDPSPNLRLTTAFLVKVLDRMPDEHPDFEYQSKPKGKVPMKKLVNGILEFQRKVLPSYRETFARLALGQSPDCFFVSCSDSRVVPNLFASTDPGDLFVMRNVGNLVPPSDAAGISVGDESEAAAIEYSVTHLGVRDIVVCGHSECGAMKAVMEGGEVQGAPNLTRWLRHAQPAFTRLRTETAVGVGLKPHNQLSQLNVLAQLEHIASYPVVKEKLARGEIRLHGWWFDIADARVYCYEEDAQEFVAIDETEALRLLARLEAPKPKLSAVR